MNFKLKRRTYILVILFVFSISLLIIPINYINDLNQIDLNNFNHALNSPQLQHFEYEPVLSEKLNSLGNISIIDIDTQDQGFLYRNIGHDNIKNDLDSGNLIARNFDINNIHTIRPAKSNNTDKSDRFETIIVKFNISITFDYNSSASGLLMYETNLHPSNLLKAYLNESLLPKDNYTIESNSAFIYNYQEHHTAENGTLNFSFTYNYSINLENWVIRQNVYQDLSIVNETQKFSLDFTYKFKISASIKTPQGSFVLAENLTLGYLFCPQDSDKLYNFEYLIGNESKDINYHKTPQNWFNGSARANQTEISLQFTTDFTVAFKNVCHDFWAIDRLVWSNNIRERIYFIEIIDGPSSIYLERLHFNELYIYYDQFKNLKTNFEREGIVEDLNTTEEDGLTPTLGLKINLPYFIKNEVLGVIIRYETTESLSVVVTDQIKMPLPGVSLKFYFFNQTYGTYISTVKSQPIPTKITDYAGQVILYNVPIGVYRVEVYNPLGQLVTNETADSSIAPNFVGTNIPHFPTTIIIFSIIYSIILGIGIWIYTKNKNLQ